MGANTFMVTLMVSIVVLASLASASIEKEPVKVTHKNSGPKYDIDDVERTKLAPQDSSENLVSPPRNPFQSGAGEPQQQQPPMAQTDDVAPIGHISIRRIFLVPMQASHSGPDMWSQGERSEPEQPRFSPRPFWPFLMPPPPSRHHLLGGDEASRSPTPESSVERPSGVERPAESQSSGESEEPGRPKLMIDPIQMMIEMMQHALTDAARAQSGPTLVPSSDTSSNKDLNKEASGTASAAEGEVKPAGEREGFFGGPIVPPVKNETKEEVVEIDGKKYLRKIVINRHVGENIIFMTKRLIFVPLNETATSEEPTTTTTMGPSSTTNNIATEASVPNQTSSPQEPSSTTSVAGEPESKEAMTTTTSAPTTVASEAPSTSAPEREETSTGTLPPTTTSGAAADEPRV